MQNYAILITLDLRFLRTSTADGITDSAFEQTIADVDGEILKKAVKVDFFKKTFSQKK